MPLLVALTALARCDRSVRSKSTTAERALKRWVTVPRRSTPLEEIAALLGWGLSHHLGDHGQTHGLVPVRGRNWYHTSAPAADVAVPSLLYKWIQVGGIQQLLNPDSLSTSTLLASQKVTDGLQFCALGPAGECGWHLREHLLSRSRSKFCLKP